MPAYCSHGQNLPLLRDSQLLSERLLIKGAELPAGESHGMRLNRHVRYGLTEVVLGELAVLPIGALHPAVAQVDHKRARLSGPRPR